MSNDQIPAWAQALIDANQQLSEEVKSLREEKKEQEDKDDEKKKKEKDKEKAKDDKVLEAIKTWAKRKIALQEAEASRK